MTTLRLRYQTVEFGSTDIHLCTLRDKQEFSDPSGIAEELGISSATWPLFGVVWPSSLVLAKHLFTYPMANKRVLEVGCGMGLSSLLLNKMSVDITATDYHPSAEEFLNRNSLLNHTNDIPFERVDWSNKEDTLGLFDLIIGSDLLYEDEHIKLLSEFILAHAKQVCEVIVVDPGRGRKNKLSNIMLDHGFESHMVKPENTEYLKDVFKGHILTFTRG